MSKEWNMNHFCCWNCEQSLDKQYIFHEEHSYCIKCYEQLLVHKCDGCSQSIGIGSKVVLLIYFAQFLFLYTITILDELFFTYLFLGCLIQ